MSIMRINKSIIPVFLSVTMLLGESCKKYLDVAPDNRTEINTLEKVAQLVGTAYPTADYLTIAEAASDNSEDKGANVGSVNELITIPGRTLPAAAPTLPTITGMAATKPLHRPTRRWKRSQKAISVPKHYPIRAKPW
jgi:hypothetical protein